MNNDSNFWLRTPAAAMQLSCSINHLKRCRDIKGGFLIGGVDYFNGSSRSSAIIWNVPSIKDKFHRRGLAIRKEVGTDKTDS